VAVVRGFERTTLKNKLYCKNTYQRADRG